ncbi:MAG TPA: NFACT RNA binding domain-containing protein [Polyangiaceae bacterium]|nr:NFACT RNA binding domain-containing protein [Polyangiaceae bacterium]
MAELDVPAALRGAFLERLDRPAPGLYALSLASDALRCALLLAAGPPRSRPAWALARARPRGDAADAHVRGLREKLEGAHITAFAESREGWALVAERGALRWRLVGRRDGVACVPVSAEEAGAAPDPTAATGAEPDPTAATGAAPDPTAATGVAPGARAEAPPDAAPAPPRPPDPGALAEAFRRGEAFVDEYRRQENEWARREALRSLRRARSRLERRLAAVEADLAAIDRAQARAHEITPFVASAARAPRGADRLEAVDWASGEAKAVTLAIDPALPAREQLEAIFARARRLRAGAPLAERRRDEATIALWRLDEALPAIEAAESAAAVASLVEALARELPRDLPLGAPKRPEARERPRTPPDREPFRRYEGEGGVAILVGRDAASNDELTVRVARPGDLWLHARDGAGSHVVVPGGYKQGSPDARALVDAATLAAHFSSFRGEGVIDVLYADRRHVRKRKGSARGEVEVLRSKTLALRTEPERLARLLATYRPPPT